MTANPVRPALTAALRPTLSSWPTMPVPRTRTARLSWTLVPAAPRPRCHGDRSLSRPTLAGRSQAGRWAASTSAQTGCGCGSVSPGPPPVQPTRTLSPSSRQPGLFRRLCIRFDDSGQRLADAQSICQSAPSASSGTAPMRVDGHRPEDRPASHPLAQALARGLIAATPVFIAG